MSRPKKIIDIDNYEIVVSAEDQVSITPEADKKTRVEQLETLYETLRRENITSISTLEVMLAKAREEH